MSCAPDPRSGYSHLSGAERLLWESAERGVKYNGDLVVLILHLSSLAPPAPRPHHIRIARVLLQDTATRYGGQVFSMRNQDLVLLAPAGLAHDGQAASEAGSLVVHAPEVLPTTLGRLFSADVPPQSRLTSLQRLGQSQTVLFDYLVACTAAPACVSSAQQHDPVLSLAALQPILDHARLPSCLCFGRHAATP